LKDITLITDAETTSILVKPEKVIDVALELKSRGFNHLSDVTVVDYLEEGDFEVIYHLWSHSDRERLIMKTRLPRDKASINTLTPLWTSAHMHERENHEMFGIKFKGHSDLSPLLLEDWEGIPPLRKDFDSRKYVIDTFYGGKRE
jgi:NADH-quinone oxidoreductase subunit C